LAASWAEVVSRIERATARLEALPPDDTAAWMEALNERSRAIARLRELVADPPEPLRPALLERLEVQLAAAPALVNKLLLLRAAAQAELARITEAVYLARSLRGRSEQRPLVDFLG
jgi:phytoene dehydrogenase-like protein